MVGLIAKGVGRGRTNDPSDVLVVEQLLVRHGRWTFPQGLPVANGTADAATVAAIEAFQRNAMGLLRPDGTVDPGGLTIRFLDRPTIAGPRHKVFREVCWARPETSAITPALFEAAATSLGCEVAAIRAVAQVETKRSAWDEEGRPTILFERHKFRTHTGGAYNRSHPDLSGPQGAYGRFSAQYPKLRRAALLDEAAALKSASWGTFQILGENHKAAGHDTVEAFVDAMMENDARHLEAFVAFVGANRAMRKALQDKDWAGFASRYNGPGYRDNDYDNQMRAAYERLRKG
jgi:hypothetical protein